MDNILSDLIQRRKEYILKHRLVPKTIKLTKNEDRRLRKVLRAHFEDDFMVPEGKELQNSLENTTKIFGMQIEVVA